MKAQKWLYLAAVATEIAGVLLVIASLAPGALDPVATVMFGETTAVDAAGRLGIGIAGALMTGWATSISILARSLDRLSAHVVGTAIAAGVGAWFVLDGIVSIVNGAALNVAGNVLFLVILMVPALALRDKARVRQPA